MNNATKAQRARVAASIKETRDRLDALEELLKRGFVASDYTEVEAAHAVASMAVDLVSGAARLWQMKRHERDSAEDDVCPTCGTEHDGDGFPVRDGW